MPMTDPQLTDIDRAHAFTQAAGERERESEHLKGSSLLLLNWVYSAPS